MNNNILTFEQENKLYSLMIKHENVHGVTI